MAVAKTPVISRKQVSYVSENLHESKTPEGSLSRHSFDYSKNRPLVLNEHIAEPGSNLPPPLRHQVMRRNCLVVHSD